MPSSTSCYPATAGRLLPDQSAGVPARRVDVPFTRLAGWIERYDARHPQTTWTVLDGRVVAVGADGSRVEFEVPWGSDDLGSVDAVVLHLAEEWQVGVVLVRRGGFAVAWAVGDDVRESKVGKRHVQGKTKAGGWSQQRFAHRRENQAKAAFDAAAEHAARILVPHRGALRVLGVGGDRRATETVLEHAALVTLADVPHRWLGGLPDPNRAVLTQAVTATRSVTVSITDPTLDDDGSRGRG